MSLIIRCLYRPGGAEARLAIRDVHLEYMIGQRDRLEQGGALLARDGATVIGMFVTLKGCDHVDAEAFLAAEPYARAGLFETTTIEALDRFVPHDDPLFLETMLLDARRLKALSGAPGRDPRRHPE
ncbi:YciI family protein [Chelatococcus reniformis]|uniref:YCII-related domain-containing protein n=1 Tax=Chelatococcus reniformis TaxID=1494448 RepID=A0A916XML3_9HYPH|nr:YciI family protein [Chelatococcus reniformis]GGC87204.1 hypothetical protein GCM10010994_51420 [Chelatococcus reniformis]